MGGTRVLAEYVTKTWAAHVEIRTKDGSSWREESIYPQGHPQNPMTDEEVREKVRRLSTCTFNQGQTEKVTERVYEMENLKFTRDLVATLIK